MLYRGDNRIQAYFTKNRPVLRLGLGFGEPQWDTLENGELLKAAEAESAFHVTRTSLLVGYPYNLTSYRKNA
jgi:hypothetical protein